MSLSEQIVVVTGAGRGIGKAVATRCAQEGARVALVARTHCQIEEACSEIAKTGGTAVSVAADVTDHAAVRVMAQRIETEMGPPDLLVNNAGSHLAIGPIWEADPDEWWTDVRVNLQGTFLVCREIIPLMVARKRGRVINLIGGGTDFPFPYGSAYGSSKAAVMRFTETLAVEVRDYGITVFALRPGFVRTAMSEFHTQNERSLRWVPHIKRRFELGEDIPASRPADLVVKLASGHFDDLSGRAIRAVDDLSTIEKQTETILASDLYTLRMGYLQTPKNFKASSHKTEEEDSVGALQTFVRRNTGLLWISPN